MVAEVSTRRVGGVLGKERGNIAPRGAPPRTLEAVAAGRQRPPGRRDLEEVGRANDRTRPRRRRATGDRRAGGSAFERLRPFAHGE